MEDEGEEFETSNQQSNYGSTLNVVLDPTFGNIGDEEEDDIRGEEDDNPNYEESQSRKVVPEHAIQILENERQNHVIISGSGWSTLKVPVPMFKVDKGAYVPMIVSIGPIHHNEPSLRAMQTQKGKIFNRLIQNQPRQPFLEESLKNAMRELEKKTRDFYALDFQAIKPDDFVQMMLLDGCFIVELLRLYEKKYMGEPFFKTRWIRANISRDILLLENQLPMFVLQKIFELTTLTGEETLNMLALRFFEPLRPGKDKFETWTLKKHANCEYIHLLALFHSALISRDNIYQKQPAKSEKKKPHLKLPGKGWVHNAKTLSYAGIKFQKTSGSILNIQLKHKKLMIPTMVINGSTNLVLRNLIAYEQNNCDEAPYFCCLAMFLDSIVDTVEDVKILCNAGIIKHAMGGDKEVANLFNRLTQELVFDIDEEDCYMTKQIEKINHLCRVHDIKVRIRRLLARMNYNGLLYTCFNVILIIILIIWEQRNNSNANSLNTQEWPPPLSSPSPF